MAKDRDRAWRRQNEQLHKDKHRKVKKVDKAMTDLQEALTVIDVDDATDLDIYQDWVADVTLDNMQERWGVVYGGIKLAAEAGEVANVIGKTMHSHSVMTDEQQARIVDELGDVLWYAAYICNSIGVRLDDVVDYNMSKINTRHFNAGTKEG